MIRRNYQLTRVDPIVQSILQKIHLTSDAKEIKHQLQMRGNEEYHENSSLYLGYCKTEG